MAGALDMLVMGGPVAWVLALLSLLSLSLIGAKALALRGTLAGAALRQRALAQWQSGAREAALTELAGGARSPADRLLLVAMQAEAAGQSRAVTERDLEWRGNAEVTALSRHVRLLELIAMVSPLLGLLGTVVGMIESFQNLALAEGAANAALLASGIWVALLTTAAGLLVAIPSGVAASLFTVRAESVASSIEAAVGAFQSVVDAG